MSDPVLTPKRILATAEDVLRRFGPGKATVVDVARALGVSHGSVYRHFPSKAALRDAVAEAWLSRIAEPLEAIAAEPGDALMRAHRWLLCLSRAKRSRLAEDPELFATYLALIADSRDVIARHVDHLREMVAKILADGVAAGTIPPQDCARSARAVLDATTRFHNPVHAAEWSDPALEADLNMVWQMIRAGLLSVNLA